MKKPWLLWSLFGVCLAVVLTALGWLSVSAWQLDRAKRAADRRTAIEDRARIALWRLDSFLAPLVAQESARPRQVFTGPLPVTKGSTDGAFARAAAAGPSSDDDPDKHVLFYFNREPQGRFSSPQIAALERRSEEEKQAAADRRDPVFRPDHASLALARHFQILVAAAERGDALAGLPAPTALPQAAPVNWPVAQMASRAPLGGVPTRVEAVDRPQQSDDDRSALSPQLQQAAPAPQGDLQMRNYAVQQAFNPLWNQNTAANNSKSASAAAEASGLADSTGLPMTPLWLDGQLTLARRVIIRGGEHIEGCVLDWPALKTSLLETIADLLPNAELEPASTDDEDDPRRLAALPLRLVPGVAGDAAPPPSTPMLLWLTAAWCGVIAAAVATGILLAGLLRLSQRRAAFVHAVTHELRTPLTTFQMYCEMLAEGMVVDPAEQKSYLRTLRTESQRLMHLVENVLSMARLERGRSVGATEPLPLADLLADIEPRLAQRAEQSQMTLRWAEAEDWAGIHVRANRAAVEQVLANLVDNACKFAAAASDRSIELAVEARSSTVEIHVRDHGPGISKSVARRLFHSFAKSAHEAANSAPGIGLGLALSRRLAQQCGGDLRWEPSPSGAHFVLALPVASEPAKRQSPASL